MKFLDTVDTCLEVLNVAHHLGLNLCSNASVFAEAGSACISLLAATQTSKPTCLLLTIMML